MFKGWSHAQLQQMGGQVQDLLVDFGDLHATLLLQLKRRERGAWVKPGLADSAGQLERALLVSYYRLAREVAQSLSGPADDVVSGRLHGQALGAGRSALRSDKDVFESRAPRAESPEPKQAEMDLALSEYGIDREEAERAPDRGRLAAILALILAWRRRQLAIAAESVRMLFETGRGKALAELGRKALVESPAARGMQEGVLGQFTGDIDRLENGLRDGTARAEGIRSIVRSAPALGVAAALLARLFDQEEYRIGMFAEALVWRAWSDGYRSAAIDGTRESLRQKGVPWSDDREAEDLSEAEREGLPRYRWSGPLDERTCGPCSEQFEHGPVLAVDEADLPAPESICAYGRACRHGWQLVEE